MAQQTMTKAPKRPRDQNQWAKRMVEIAAGEVKDRATRRRRLPRAAGAAPSWGWMTSKS